MALFRTTITQSERLLPQRKLATERLTPLSLLDATSVDFLDACAVWLFDYPGQSQSDQFNLSEHLRQSLRITLDAYPQWAGLLRIVNTVTSTASSEDEQLPPHARRFGRVHVSYGTPRDPGIDFVVASSDATLETLCPASRTTSQPLWDRSKAPLAEFVSQTPLQKLQKPIVADEAGVLPPAMAVQLTTLACGGFVLSVKSAHPLADAHSLMHFVKDLASVSRSLFSGSELPSLQPHFQPDMLDSSAAGDINAPTADQAIIQQAHSLPFHRYDWWTQTPNCDQRPRIPEAFQNEDLTPAGKPIPWFEWNLQEPASVYEVHLTSDQVEVLWQEANAETPDTSATSAGRISRHDAVLAHIWSCVNRARQLDQDPGPVHCDLTYGQRPVLQLGEHFIGSPTGMMNIEMTGHEATASTSEPGSLRRIAQRIRETIGQVSRPDAVAAHLHSLAYEKSPQRIWQGFLGRRHFMVTPWARAGLYEIDLGLGGGVRYADGILSAMDGLALIKEAPPSARGASSKSRSWTASGVDVVIGLRTEDMDRFLGDPQLLPEQTPNEAPRSSL
ncbi:transferase family protein [Aspergillus steynii IBT 23096]|uniref:Transferase family protein n=1 Tax=Aspergillus steynii IBT 23096 TaxID=1392250 RepID=A0A2I2GJN1_9EURO|nr:transferase family protein [Aspergillus steynii IBT 23096]PLB53085.1 transferase family protein [Aspergillus steynii IBT 23096]